MVSIPINSYPAQGGVSQPQGEVDVAIVGAGPTGLMLANLLGQYGVRVVVLEGGPQLIDFPRGVGMDDETLRTFQTAGLVENVLPHTIPHQLLVFVDAKQRDLARLAPPMADFGWPRRNGFVQPLADRVLLEGLSRYDNVTVEWSSEVTGFSQDDRSVTVHVSTDGAERVVRAAYVVGADGGRSTVRKSLGLEFEGSSSTADWFVIDIRNDPLGRPGAYVCADPRRPYVSISIPHGIRRFEFMLKPGETEQQAMTDEFVNTLLQPLVPRGARVDIIRRRVYTHHSRMATRFRSGRAFLIGDAAHVMPVWQGQGYNSGIRDSLNLAWKLAMAVRGQAGEALLDSYELERREHVRAMMDLSTRVGKAVSVTNRFVASLRNAFFRSLSAVPRAKSYIVQMRFKPMPTMDVGALTASGSGGGPVAVGRLFIQPTITTRTYGTTRLDDAIGPWFALIAWNNDPRSVLDEDALSRLQAAGVKLVAARPRVQLHWEDARPHPDVLIVGDDDGSLKRWFDDREESVILLRPDRIVGGASPAYGASDMVRSFFATIGAPAPQPQESTASEPDQTAEPSVTTQPPTPSLTARRAV